MPCRRSTAGLDRMLAFGDGTPLAKRSRIWASRPPGWDTPPRPGGSSPHRCRDAQVVGGHPVLSQGAALAPPPARFGLVLTAPAPDRALGQLRGPGNPAHPRSLTTQSLAVCPGPATALDGPRPTEHKGALLLSPQTRPRPRPARSGLGAEFGVRFEERPHARTRSVSP